MSNEGRASVEIVGDVRDFAKKTEKDLNDSLKKVKPDPVRVPIDTDRLKTDSDRAGEQLADGITRGAEGRFRGTWGRFFSLGREAGDRLGEGIGAGADRKTRSLWSRFTETGRKIGDTLGKVAGSRFGQVFGKSVKGIGNVLGKALSGAGGLLTKGLKGVGSAVTGVLGGIVSALGGVFKFFFASLVGLVIQASPAISAAITAAVGIGLGAAFIGLGALALRESKPLQNAFKGVLKTLDNVARRAAQPMLKPLIASAKIFSDTIKQLEKPLKSIFGDLAKQIKPLASNFGMFVKNALGGIKDAMPGITAAFEAFSTTLPAIGKGIGDFFRTLFANSSLIDNATNGVLALIGTALKPLGSVLSGLTVIFAAWGNMVKLFSGTLLPRIIAGFQSFVDGGTGALGRITEAWGPLGDAIQNVWNKIKEFAAEDNEAQLEAKFLAIVESIKQAWAPLQNFLSVLWGEIVAFIKRKWNEDFIPWWDGTAKPWLQQAVSTAFSMAWDAAVRIVGEKLSQIQNRVGAWLSALPGRIGGWLASIPNAFATAFARALATAAAGATRVVNGVVSRIRQLPGRVRSALTGVRNAVVGAFAGAASWLASAGANIINGLVNAIRAGFGRVRSTLSNLTSLLPSWKGPEAVDKKILYRPGQMVMQGFEQGLLDSRRSIARTLGGLTGDLPSFAAPNGQRGYGSTTNLTGGLTFNINVSGVTGQAAGRQAAEQVLKELAAAGLVR